MVPSTLLGARCPLCLRLLKRFKYLRRHARTVHSVPPSGESLFIRRAKELRMRRPAIEQNLRWEQDTSSHFLVACRVSADEDCVAGHATPAADDKTPPSASSPSLSSPVPDFELTSASESESDGEGPPRKRATRDDLDRSGFLSNLEKRCAPSLRFERLLIEVSGISRLSAARKAGVLHRYLAYTRAREPSLDDVERLTTLHVALSTLQEYRQCFSPRSVSVLADSIKCCVRLLQYCRPLQLAFDYDPKKHRESVDSACVMWAEQRAKANREAALRQRCAMSKDPLESWTHLVPVEAMVDYLREHSTAEPEGRTPALCILTAQDPDVPVPQSAHDRHVIRKRYAQVRAVAGLHLVLAGVRLCVALTLTADDIERATEWGEYWIVSVKRHKTSKYHGAAHIVLRAPGLRALSDLARATTEYFGPEEASHRNLFGLTAPHGRACPEIFHDFNGFVRERGYDRDFTSLSFNKARSATESFSHLLGSDGDRDKSTDSASVQRSISDFLLHSQNVRNMYYRKCTYSALVGRWTIYNSLLAVMYILETARAGRITLRLKFGKSSYFFFVSHPFFIRNIH